jgi:hypothetical protein
MRKLCWLQGGAGSLPQRTQAKNTEGAEQGTRERRYRAPSTREPWSWEETSQSPESRKDPAVQHTENLFLWFGSRLRVQGIHVPMSLDYIRCQGIISVR